MYIYCVDSVISHVFSQRGGQTNVGLRRKLLHLSLLGFRKSLEVLNELNEFVLAHGSFAAGEVLKLLIGVRDVELAHDGLHRLCQKFVMLCQLSVELCLVDSYAAKAFLNCADSLKVVAEGNTKVSKHCGVGEITLEAGDRQLVCKVSKQSS